MCLHYNTSLKLLRVASIELPKARVTCRAPVGTYLGPPLYILGHELNLLKILHLNGCCKRRLSSQAFPSRMQRSPLTVQQGCLQSSPYQAISPGSSSEELKRAVREVEVVHDLSRSYSSRPNAFALALVKAVDLGSAKCLAKVTAERPQCPEIFH